MKKHVVILIAALIAITGICSGQNLTFSSNIDNNHYYLLPVKAGSSTQTFQLTITNKDTAAYTVSIDKAALVPCDTWVTVDNNNSLTIPK